MRKIVNYFDFIDDVEFIVNVLDLFEIRIYVFYYYFITYLNKSILF